jgi:hypothetical protein
MSSLFSSRYTLFTISFIEPYALLGLVIGWSLQGIDFLLTLNFQKRTKGFQKYYVLTVVLMPLYAPIYIFSKGYAGYNSTHYTHICIVSEDAAVHMSLYLIFLPAITIACIGFLCYFLVLVNLGRHRRSFGRKNSSNLLKTIQHGFLDRLRRKSLENVEEVNTIVSPSEDPGSRSSKQQHRVVRAEKDVLLNLIYILVFLALFAYRLELNRLHDSMMSSYRKWTRCVFENYDESIGDNSWRSVCGDHAHTRISFVLLVVLVIAMNCQSILVAFISFKSDADVRWLRRTETFKYMKRKWQRLQFRWHEQVHPMQPMASLGDHDVRQSKEKIEVPLFGEKGAPGTHFPVMGNKKPSKKNVMRENDSKEDEVAEMSNIARRGSWMNDMQWNADGPMRLRSNDVDGLQVAKRNSDIDYSYYFRFHSSSSSDYVMALSKRWWNIPMISVAKSGDGVGEFEEVPESGRRSVRTNDVTSKRTATDAVVINAQVHAAPVQMDRIIEASVHDSLVAEEI